MRDTYTADVLDPPLGWDDSAIELRHHDIPGDQVGNVVQALLANAHRLWLQAGQPGKAAPAVTVSFARAPQSKIGS